MTSKTTRPVRIPARARNGDILHFRQVEAAVGRCEQIRGTPACCHSERLKLAQRFRVHVDRCSPFDPEFPTHHILGQQEYITQDGRARLAGQTRRDGNPICPHRVFLARHAPWCVALASLNQRHVHDSSRLDRRQQRLNDRHESGNQRHLVAGENENSKFAP